MPTEPLFYNCGGDDEAGGGTWRYVAIAKRFVVEHGPVYENTKIKTPVPYDTGVLFGPSAPLRVSEITLGLYRLVRFACSL